MVDTRDQYDGLASLYLPIALAIFALIVAAFAVALWRYRAGRRDRADERAEHRALEGGWIAFVAAIVAVLLIATLRVESRVDRESAPSTLDVGVLAAKWDWHFSYADGPTLRDQVVVPAGRTVRFQVRSLDVLHDFWVPDLRFQRQVWPKHEERFELVFAHAGTYQGVCSWFCGLRHQNMHFAVRALDPGAFDLWQAQHLRR